MNKEEIFSFLNSDKKHDIDQLFSRADQARKDFVGDAIHLRGIIEFSNYCKRNCAYCGLRRDNKNLKRYRMDYPEIFRHAIKAKDLKIPTVVLQSGEDPWYKIDKLCALIREIKKLGLVVTLSIGECSYADYKKLRKAGADRYLLRFETSDPKLYKKLKPGCLLSTRLSCLKNLKRLGFETGSGVMVGLPGQTDESLADDIMLFKKFKLDMIGVGPFIPHPHTPLARNKTGTLEKVLKVLALTRIVTKNTNIPATTAVGTIDALGRQKALACGANVLMPNITDAKYRKLYQIYPDKICISEDALRCRGCVEKMARALGRTIVSGANL
ncbi:MAG: [FeFe] hydrogenase H-cluster radical SAM maturase HydE [Candidatus Omnitrophica bacterium]|jgi:biotin synthase|nr:[FeFe] hydrogenase H-cluster radical SAM maturase HydE [Candidatus Omnitrophota bacterium]